MYLVEDDLRFVIELVVYWKLIKLIFDEKYIYFIYFIFWLVVWFFLLNIYKI